MVGEGGAERERRCARGHGSSREAERVRGVASTCTTRSSTRERERESEREDGRECERERERGRGRGRMDEGRTDKYGVWTRMTYGTYGVWTSGGRSRKREEKRGVD